MKKHSAYQILAILLTICCVSLLAGCDPLQLATTMAAKTMTAEAGLAAINAAKDEQAMHAALQTYADLLGCVGYTDLTPMPQLAVRKALLANRPSGGYTAATGLNSEFTTAMQKATARAGSLGAINTAADAVAMQAAIEADLDAAPGDKTIGFTHRDDYIMLSPVQRKTVAQAVFDNRPLDGYDSVTPIRIEFAKMFVPMNVKGTVLLPNADGNKNRVIGFENPIEVTLVRLNVYAGDLNIGLNLSLPINGAWELNNIMPYQVYHTGGTVPLEFFVTAKKDSIEYVFSGGKAGLSHNSIPVQMQFIKVASNEAISAIGGSDVRWPLNGMYQQSAEILLTAAQWTPIGSNVANSFTGVYDGAGKTIMNLQVSSGAYVGLFGYIATGSELRNINLGTGSVSSTITGSRVGGICGYNAGTISGSRTSVTVTGVGNTGGVCGESVGTIIASYNIGTIDGGTGDNIGGICGLVSGGNITACYTISAVIGTGNNIGGICGTVSNGGPIACYWRDFPDDDAGNGIGDYSGSPSDAEALPLTLTDWPNAAANSAWRLDTADADGTYDGIGTDGDPSYWRDMGYQNNAAQAGQGPLLWWEPIV